MSKVHKQWIQTCKLLIDEGAIVGITKHILILSLPSLDGKDGGGVGEEDGEDEGEGVDDGNTEETSDENEVSLGR